MSYFLEGSTLGDHVYSGVLDDVMATYSGWPGGSPSAQKLDTLLRRVALFERPILLNDGYLLHQRWGQQQLADPNSLLRIMMAQGLVVILSRMPHGALHEMPEAMSDKVSSYRQLTSSNDWPELREALRRVVQDPEYRWTCWPSANNAPGFERLMDLAENDGADTVLEEQSRPHWARIYDEFKAHRLQSPHRGARDIWQKAVARIEREDIRADFLNLGNEIYHYNMALLFAGATNTDVAVQTRYSSFATNRFAPPPTVSEQITTDGTGFELKGLADLPAKAFARVAFDSEVQQTRQAFLEARAIHKKGIIYDPRIVNETKRQWLVAIQHAAERHRLSKVVSTTERVATWGSRAGLATSLLCWAAPATAAFDFGALQVINFVVTVGLETNRHIVSRFRYRPKEVKSNEPALSGSATGTFWVDRRFAQQHLQADENHGTTPPNQDGATT